MTKTVTITLSDEQYEALAAAAARAHQSPEELAAAAIAVWLVTSGRSTDTTAPRPEDPVLAVMRARGHLVDPSTLPPYPGADDIPPRGTPERQRFEDELGDALSDALEQSGLSILDLIERR